MVDQLHKVIRLRCDSSSQAQAQIDYYIRHGYLTVRMKDQAKEIIDREWENIKPKRLQKTHYLYAISNGQYIKVGMSSCIDRRIKALQTASPTKLTRVWACYAGENDKEARKHEKKLHRALKRYAVGGEWFGPQCMSVVDGWRVKSLNAKLYQDAVKTNDDMDKEFSAIMSTI